MTTRKEVEEWLKKAPKSIQLDLQIEIEPMHESVNYHGRMTPSLIKKGYEGNIRFRCTEWGE